MNWGYSIGIGPFRVGLSQTGRKLMLGLGARTGKFRQSGRIEIAPALLGAARLFVGGLREQVANALHPSPVVEAPTCARKARVVSVKKK